MIDQSPFKYPMVIKQVNELLIVSVPDLEITVSSPALTQTMTKADWLQLSQQLTLQAMNQVRDKLRRMAKLGKEPIRHPSYIRQNLRPSDNATISTKDAAQYLNISQATLKRWESRGIVQATKSLGGHRSFDLEELNRILKQMQTGAIST